MVGFPGPFGPYLSDWGTHLRSEGIRRFFKLPIIVIKPALHAF